LSSKPFPIILTKSNTPSVEIIDLIEAGKYQVITADNSEGCFLSYNDQSLTISMQLHSNNDRLNLCIDFVGGKAKHRRQYGGGKNQPLAKACGIDKHPDWTILDATAGLGKDAFVLASLGATVTLCEQHPALYGLLADGVCRASEDLAVADIASRMTCVNQDSIVYFNSLRSSTNALPNVIYLDPMYPERKKSAKIKKEMQILQYLVGHTDDNKLLAAALTTATHRVVVKRPKSATPLNDKPPSYSVSSVNTRYDIYVI